MWERVWIDTIKLDYYTIRGKKYGKGTVVQQNYLLRLMDQFRYFSEEDTQLQYTGR